MAGQRTGWDRGLGRGEWGGGAQALEISVCASELLSGWRVGGGWTSGWGLGGIWQEASHSRKLASFTRTEKKMKKQSK